MNAEPTFIMWLDPGAVTGWAAYDLELDVFTSGQCSLDELRQRYEALVPSYGHRMAVGWELFINTSGGARSSTPGPSNEAIGVTRSIAEKHGIRILKPQPSSARNLGSPAFLRRLGWYKPGKGHANDASQHLLAYLIRQRPMHDPIREKLFPGYQPRGTLAP